MLQLWTHFLHGLVLLVCYAFAAIDNDVSDLVGDLPGFPPASMRPMKSYSGFLHVSLPNGTTVGSYDGWVIHYQLELQQHTKVDCKTQSLTAWHTGGPGGSSIYGLYGEVLNPRTHT